MGAWFREYRPGDPVRLVANVEETNRVHRILDDLQGIGCRIVKPRGANGKGWRIIVDGTSDLDPIPDSDIGTDTGDIAVKPYDLNNAVGVPAGGCLWWPYDPAVKPIPPGWVEATEMRGLYPVGYLNADTDFGTYGAFAGSRSHAHSMNLDHTHEIPVGVFPGPPTGTDVANPLDTDYNQCLTYVSTPGTIGEGCGITDTGRGAGITWCGTGGSGNVSSGSAKHLPPSFVGVWIKKL